MIYLAAIVATVVWAVMYVVLPWVVRIGVLTALHDLRDSLYAAGGRPGTRDTLLYRDVEFVLCYALNRVRADDLEAVEGMLRSALAPSDASEARPALYDASIQLLGTKAADTIVAKVLPAIVALSVYALFARPQRLLVVVPVAAWEIARSPALAGPLGRIASVTDNAVQHAPGGLVQV